MKPIPIISPDQHIMEWGITMRLARRAGALATEDARRRGVIKDRIECGLVILTDCPVAAGWFAFSDDLAAVCGVSWIEGVRIVFCDPGDTPPVNAFEAERSCQDEPRVWARLA